jgi:hypothetical protein
MLVSDARRPFWELYINITYPKAATLMVAPGIWRAMWVAGDLKVRTIVEPCSGKANYLGIQNAEKRHLWFQVQRNYYRGLL